MTDTDVGHSPSDSDREMGREQQRRKVTEVIADAASTARLAAE